MKFKYNLLFVIISVVYLLSGCFPNRVPTDPNFKAQDVRRPGVAHHVPLSGATEVSRNTTVTIWFDELMNNASVQNNFLVWPSVTIDSMEIVVIDPNDPEIIYAVRTGKGIFKSEDGAESWNWLTPESMQMPITELVVCQSNSDILFAATTDSGLYKSLDRGVSWQSVNGLPEKNILAAAVDPTNSDVIYVCTKSSGIYKSEDGGLSWDAKNNGVRPIKAPQDIIINPLDSKKLYAATKGDFVLKSVNGGDKWSRLRTGFYTFYFNTVAIHPQDTSRVFAVSDGGGIYRSRNSGANWELIIKGLTSLDILSVAVHPQDTSKIILSSAAGIFKSLDGGDSWFSTGDIPTDVVISMLVIDPLTPDHVVAATTSGIYHSEDLGDSWIEKNNLPLEFLLVAGSFSFETWQDSTVVIAPFNSTTMDTTIIFPYIYERALAAWIAGGMKGEPPVDANPLATKMVFIPGTILPPSTKIQVRVKGSFESDRETLRDSYGAEDVNGNSLELDYNFSFTTSKN